MEIWIIRDGEKTGPFHDFEIRRRIESGDLEATTSAWHEGLERWKPLVELPLFRREFEIRNAQEPEKPAETKTISPPPPPLPQQHVFGRRFWARWLDLTIYSAIWWLGMWLARQDIEAAFSSQSLIFLRYIPWFIIEAVLIHYIATTPGKWLMGLRVTNLDGSRLSLRQSTARAFKVLLIGIGFGFSIIAIFCQTMSYLTAKRLGSPLWDHVGGHRVAVAPLHAFRVIGLVALFFSALTLHSLIFAPYLVKTLSQNSPEWRKLLEENPPLQLPVRHRNPEDSVPNLR